MANRWLDKYGGGQSQQTTGQVLPTQNTVSSNNRWLDKYNQPQANARQSNQPQSFIGKVFNPDTAGESAKTAIKSTGQFASQLAKIPWNAIKELGRSAVSVSPTQILADVFNIKTSVPTPSSRLAEKIDQFDLSKYGYDKTPGVIGGALSYATDLYVAGRLITGLLTNPHLKIVNPMRSPGNGKVTGELTLDKTKPATQQQSQAVNSLMKTAPKNAWYRTGNNQVTQLQNTGDKILVRQYEVKPSYMERIFGSAKQATQSYTRAEQTAIRAMVSNAQNQSYMQVQRTDPSLANKIRNLDLSKAKTLSEAENMIMKALPKDISPQLKSDALAYFRSIEQARFAGVADTPDPTYLTRATIYTRPLVGTDMSSVKSMNPQSNYMKIMVNQAIKNPQKFHAVLDMKGEIQGLMLIDKVGNQAYIGDVGVLTGARGQNLTVQALADYSVQNPEVTRILGQATGSAASFWKRLGATFTGKGGRFFIGVDRLRQAVPYMSTATGLQSVNVGLQAGAAAASSGVVGLVSKDIPLGLQRLSNQISGLGFEEAKKFIVSQVSTVEPNEKIDDETVNAVFSRLQNTARSGLYDSEKEISQLGRNAQRLSGTQKVKIYRASNREQILPGQFVTTESNVAQRFTQGDQKIVSKWVPKNNLIRVSPSGAGGDELIYLPKNYKAPERVKTFDSFRDFYNTVNQAKQSQAIVPVSRPRAIQGKDATEIERRNELLNENMKKLQTWQSIARGENVKPTYRVTPADKITEPRVNKLPSGVTILERTPSGIKPVRYASRPIIVPETVEEAKYIARINQRGAVVTEEFVARVPEFRRPSKFERTLIPLHRIIDYVDPSGVLQREVIRPIDIAMGQIAREHASTLERFSEVIKGIRRNSKADKEIFHFIDGDKTIKLDDKQKAAVEWIKKYYQVMLGRINNARASIGKDPVPERKDYITHIREFTLLDNLYGDASKIPDEELVALKYAKPNSPAFKFAKQRLGGRSADSAIGAVEAYIHPSLKTVHLSQPVTNARAHIQYLQQNEPLFSMLNEYLNSGVLGMPTQIDRALESLPLVREITIASDWMVTRTGAGVILGNISSVLSNFGGLVQSLGELGEKYFAIGLKRSLDKTWRQFAIDNSDIVFKRYRGDLDVGFNPFQKTGSLFKKFVGMPFKAVEVENVMTAWLGAYQKFLDDTAIQNGAELKVNADAIEYANKAALRTQGGYSSYEAPELFRVKAIRPFTQFQLAAQNFYIQLGYDPTRLRYNAPSEPPKLPPRVEGQPAVEPPSGGRTTAKSAQKNNWAKALRLMIYAMLADAAYRKIRGYGLFFDNPLQRRGVPAAYRFAAALYDYGIGYVTDDIWRKRSARYNLIKGGVTFISAGGQAYKTWDGIAAIDRGFAVDTAGRRKFDVLTNKDKIKVLLFGTGGFPNEDRELLDAMDKYQKYYENGRENVLDAMLDGNNDKANEIIDDMAINMNVSRDLLITSIVTGLESKLEGLQTTTVRRKFDSLSKPVKLQILQELKSM